MMRKFGRLLAAGVLVGALVGCAASVDSEEAIDAQKELLKGMQQRAAIQNRTRPAFRVHEGVFVTDGSHLPIPRNAGLPAIFEKEVSLRWPESNIRGIASAVSQVTGLAVELAPELTPAVIGGGEGGGGSGGDAVWKPNYHGTILGLLDSMATQFGAHWAWDDENSVINVFRTKQKVFTLAAAPGSWSAINMVTNQASTGSGEGGGGGDTGTTSTSASNQTVEMTIELDIWASTLADVRSSLSAIGRAEANPATGSITVTDTPAVLRRVGDYIDRINHKLNRQIDISVKVYALTLSAQEALNFSLGAVIQDTAQTYQAAFAGAAPNQFPAGAGTATAVVLPEALAVGGRLANFTGTNIVVQALQAKGDVAEITEGGAITRNNVPAPIQHTHTETYIAKRESSTSALGGTQSSIEPGTIVSGFSLLATPHMLDNGKVLLNYGVNMTINPVIRQLGNEESGIGAPSYTKRDFTSEVILTPGETLLKVAYKDAVDNNASSTGLLSYYKNDTRDRVVVILALTVNVLPT